MRSARHHAAVGPGDGHARSGVCPGSAGAALRFGGGRGGVVQWSGLLGGVGPARAVARPGPGTGLVSPTPWDELAPPDRREGRRALPTRTPLEILSPSAG